MKTKTIVLVGQPGSGKSTIFDVLNDIKVPPAGTTINYQISQINLFGETYNLVDLPGIYSLNPSDPAEKVTSNYLLNEDYDLIINVINSPMLSRSLELTVELIEFGKPMVVALNMQDEAAQHGVRIDAEKLSEILNVPVTKTSARFGKGTKKLADICFERLNKKIDNNEINTLKYTQHLESKIEEIEDLISKNNISNNGSLRFWAIKSIENSDLLANELKENTSLVRKEFSESILEMHGTDAYETIHYERHHHAMNLSEKTSKLVKRNDRTISEKLDDYLLHPVIGHFFHLSFLFLYFTTIYYVGNFLTYLVDAPIANIAELFASLKSSNEFLWYTINGAYMGFAGVAGIVFPYFLPLVFLTSVMEDTGYTTRAAFLMDGFMHKIGLHGKSFVPFILGVGCSVPALYATRVIENKRDRMITGILIPFIPCTARIAVIFALAAAFAGPIWALIIFLFIGLIIAINGKILSKIISKPVGMIMEITPLKLPSMKLSLRRTWFKIKDFVKEAIIFLIGGSIILGWIEYFNVAHYLNILFAPVLDFILGLPKELGSTLIFGFFRKELIIVMANQALGVPSLSMLPLSVDQIIVFVVFVSLYFPCFTTLIVLWKEFGTKTVILSSTFSIVIAVISGFMFKIIFEIF